MLGHLFLLGLVDRHHVLVGLNLFLSLYLWNFVCLHHDLQFFLVYDVFVVFEKLFVKPVKNMVLLQPSLFKLFFSVIQILEQFPESVVAFIEFVLL